MPWLVFDVQTTTGYLFETRHKWLAHTFCVITDFTRRIGLSKVVYDYDNTMDFGPSEAEREAVSQEALDWNEVYNHA